MTQARDPIDGEPVHSNWAERPEQRVPIDAEPVHASWSEQRAPLAQRDRHSGITAGIILIALGAVFLIAQIVRLENALLFVLGIGFYVAYFVAGRSRGLLVAGGVLGGLGLGTLVRDLAGLSGSLGSGVLFLCWALGWASIWLIDQRLRWALWPAAVFAAIGAISTATAIPGLDQYSSYVWPLVLIAIGAWLLLRRQRAS